MPFGIFQTFFFSCNGTWDALGEGARTMNDGYRNVSNSLLLDNQLILTLIVRGNQSFYAKCPNVILKVYESYRMARRIVTRATINQNIVYWKSVVVFPIAMITHPAY